MNKASQAMIDAPDPSIDTNKAIAMVNADIRHLIARASEISFDAKDLADRLLGSAGEYVGGIDAPNDDAGEIEQVRRSLGNLGYILDCASLHLDRLKTL